MKDDFRAFSKEIKSKLEGMWTKTEVEGLLNNGVVSGISKKLELRDKEDGTNTREIFLRNDYIKKILDIEEKEYSEKNGAEMIIEFMKSNGLTSQDLCVALTMMQATKTGVRDAEEHIIQIKESDQQSKDGDEYTQA